MFHKRDWPRIGDALMEWVLNLAFGAGLCLSVLAVLFALTGCMSLERRMAEATCMSDPWGYMTHVLLTRCNHWPKAHSVCLCKTRGL